MNYIKETPQIWSIDKLLDANLIIPDYQRPYKWTDKNITDLILDIQKSIEDNRKYSNFKYRIGTVILHENENNEYEIVDGQQRILSFLLLYLYFQPKYTCKLLDTKFSNKVTQKNLHDNYRTIAEWFSSVDKDGKDIFEDAMKNILEVVVIIVDNISEAFQLFDSQNTRGRALYPHDLLKAYHLREIHDKYEMQNAVINGSQRIRNPSGNCLISTYIPCGTGQNAGNAVISPQQRLTYIRALRKVRAILMHIEPIRPCLTSCSLNLLYPVVTSLNGRSLYADVA